MPTVETVNDSPVGHKHEAGLQTEEAQCPYCGGPVTRKQFREIRGRIETEERVRIDKVEQTLKDRFAREWQQAETKAKVAVEQAKREAAKLAEQQIKALRANQEAVVEARLKTQREASEKKLGEAVNAERAKHFDEKLKLEEQLQDMQRRLQRKTAHELGEPAEVDLFETLQTAFPDDRISRVVKGVKGPDVLVEVIHNGAAVGKIALDSKNHRRWLHAFTRKLRADQLTEGADFAILSSSVFPAGAQQLHIQDNVIVANPARVPVLVHLLRRQVIENHVLKLGSEARNEKADKLFSFIISPACTDLLDRITKLTEDMVALDVKEASVHETTWKKRADLVSGLQAVHAEFSGAVSRIIDGSEASI
jgi:hypothetical protein